MSEKFLFDEASVKALESGDREWRAWDEELEGFGVRVRPSGTKSWIVSVKTRREDGKVRTQRITIGRPEEMSLEKARAKARELLDQAAGDDVRDDAVERSPTEGGESAVLQDDQAAQQDRGEPMQDRPRGSQQDRGPTPDTGADAEPAAAAVTPAGDEYNRETGEILPARENSTEYSDPDEDLGDYEEGVPPEPGRNPGETVAGPGHDENAMRHIIEATVDGTARHEEYESVADAEREAVALPVREPEVSPETERETGTESPDAGAGGNAAEEGADETEGDASRPGRAGRARGAVAGAAGKVMGLGRALKPGGREKRAAKEERAVATQEEPEPEPSAGTEPGDAGKGGPEPSGEPKLDAKTEVSGAAEGNSREGNRLSEESVAGLAKNLDGVRGVVDRIEAWSEKVGSQMELLSGSAAVIAVDRRQRWRRVARTVLVMAVAAAVGLAGGAAVQSRIEVLPQADPTLGWKDHVWNHYGEAFMGCFDQARETDTGRANCTMEVRAR